MYRDKILPLIDEDKFRHLFNDTTGAPNKSIKLMVSVLIFMSIELFNWREAEFQLERRIDWLVATNSDIGKTHVDHTTLFKFFGKLEKDKNKTAYNLFIEISKKFIDECKISIAKQRTDSFFMHGWLKILSRYGLFKETNRCFLQSLRKHQPSEYDQINSELSKDYLEINFDLTEKNKERANKKIKEMANDMFLLKNAFENHSVISGYESFKTLIAVFEQQCSTKDNDDNGGDEVTKANENSSFESSDNSENKENSEAQVLAKIEDKEENHSAPEVVILEKPLKAEDGSIISTPHNVDAVYTRKKDQKVTGHKGFVTETCDENNEVQFITDVALEAATHADSKELDEMEKRLIENGLKPTQLFGDAGFVNGGTILSSEQNDILLEGPSSGKSQDLKEYNNEERRLDVSDFEIEVENDGLRVLSCPKGEVPNDQKPSKKQDESLLAHFEHKTCSECEKAGICPIKIGKKVATLTVSHKQYVAAKRHQKYMNNKEYRKECATRAGAEATVNEIANVHGARKSNHKTEGKSRLQMIFSAISTNTKRFIKIQQEKCVKILSKQVESQITEF